MLAPLYRRQVIVAYAVHAADVEPVRRKFRAVVWPRTQPLRP